jgi:hypothetical protein
MSETMSSASNEKLDFSSDGQQPTEKLWTVVRSEVVEVDGGTQWQLELAAEGEPFNRTETFWLRHEEVPGKSWSKTVEISRGIAKRVARALTGEPSITPAEAMGKKLLATIAEDANGFIRLSRFKAAPAEEAIR